MSYCGNIVKYNQALQIVRDRLAKNAGAKSFVSTQTSIPIGITLKNTIKLLRVSEFIEERKNFTWKSFTRFLGMLPTGIVLKKRFWSLSVALSSFSVALSSVEVIQYHISSTRLHCFAL